MRRKSKNIYGRTGLGIGKQLCLWIDRNYLLEFVISQFNPRIEGSGHTAYAVPPFPPLRTLTQAEGKARKQGVEVLD